VQHRRAVGRLTVSRLKPATAHLSTQSHTHARTHTLMVRARDAWRVTSDSHWTSVLCLALRLIAATTCPAPQVTSAAAHNHEDYS